MSNREISAWGNLLVTTAIWATYFVNLVQVVASGELVQDGFARTLGVPLAIAIALSTVAALTVEFLVHLVRHERPTRRQAEDEAWAGLRATRMAHCVVITLIMALSGLALVLGALAGPSRVAQISAGFGNGLVLFGNAGLFVLVLADLVHYAALLVFLRRGR